MKKKKLPIGYHFCGFVIFVYNFKTDKWIVDDIFLSKYTLSANELRIKSIELVNKLNKDKKYKNKTYNVRDFKTKQNFKTLLKNYEQTTSTINKNLKVLIDCYKFEKSNTNNVNKMLRS